jgi:hypothetical protein
VRTDQKDVQCWMGARAIGRMSPGQSRPQGGHGVSQNWVPTRISGETRPESWHQNVGNVGPKVTTWRGVIWPRILYCRVGEGENRERERGGGRVLNTPQ